MDLNDKETVHKGMDQYFFRIFRYLKLSYIYTAPIQKDLLSCLHPENKTMPVSAPSQAYVDIIYFAERIQLPVLPSTKTSSHQESYKFWHKPEINEAIQGSYYQLFKQDLKNLATIVLIATVLALPVVREFLVTSTVLIAVTFAIAYIGCLALKCRQELKKDLYLPEIEKIQSFSMAQTC